VPGVNGVSSIRRLIPVRSAILWGASIALFALLAGCVLFGLWVWSGLANLADRIAAVSVGIGAATLFITVIAALVALAAYHAATQAPDLQPQILFPGSEPNRPRLVSNPQQAQEGVFGKFADFSQLVARVRIYNASKFSARNPLMRIRLRNLSGVKESNSPYGWESLDGDANGTTWFQWEGGADQMVHGKSLSFLPNLRVPGLMTLGPEPPSLTLEVLAEGSEPRTVVVPVEVISPQEWCAEDMSRITALPPELQLLVNPTRDPDPA
jgi:hypothetical protein